MTNDWPKPFHILHLVRFDQAALKDHNKTICAVNILCLFIMMPWVGLQCVISAFPGHMNETKLMLLLQINGDFK